MAPTRPVGERVQPPLSLVSEQGPPLEQAPAPSSGNQGSEQSLGPDEQASSSPRHGLKVDAHDPLASRPPRQRRRTSVPVPTLTGIPTRALLGSPGLVCKKTLEPDERAAFRIPLPRPHAAAYRTPRRKHSFDLSPTPHRPRRKANAMPSGTSRAAAVDAHAPTPRLSPPRATPAADAHGTCFDGPAPSSPLAEQAPPASADRPSRVDAPAAPFHSLWAEGVAGAARGADGGERSGERDEGRARGAQSQPAAAQTEEGSGSPRSSGASDVLLQDGLSQAQPPPSSQERCRGPLSPEPSATCASTMPFTTSTSTPLSPAAAQYADVRASSSSPRPPPRVSPSPSAPAPTPAPSCAGVPSHGSRARASPMSATSSASSSLDGGAATHPVVQETATSSTSLGPIPCTSNPGSLDTTCSIELHDDTSADKCTRCARDEGDKGALEALVEIPGSHVITLTLDPLDPICLVKAKIFAVERIPIHAQVLRFEGNLLHDERAVKEYGIGQSSVLRLSLRLAGGVDQAPSSGSPIQAVLDSYPPQQAAELRSAVCWFVRYVQGSLSHYIQGKMADEPVEDNISILQRDLKTTRGTKRVTCTTVADIVAYLTSSTSPSLLAAEDGIALATVAHLKIVALELTPAGLAVQTFSTRRSSIPTRVMSQGVASGSLPLNPREPGVVWVYGSQGRWTTAVENVSWWNSDLAARRAELERRTAGEFPAKGVVVGPEHGRLDVPAPPSSPPVSSRAARVAPSSPSARTSTRLGAASSRRRVLPSTVRIAAPSFTPPSCVGTQPPASPRAPGPAPSSSSTIGPLGSTSAVRLARATPSSGLSGPSSSSVASSSAARPPAYPPAPSRTLDSSHTRQATLIVPSDPSAARRAPTALTVPPPSTDGRLGPGRARARPDDTSPERTRTHKRQRREPSNEGHELDLAHHLDLTSCDDIDSLISLVTSRKSTVAWRPSALKLPVEYRVVLPDSDELLTSLKMAQDAVDKLAEVTDGTVTWIKTSETKYRFEIHGAKHVDLLVAGVARLFEIMQAKRQLKPGGRVTKAEAAAAVRAVQDAELAHLPALLNLYESAVPNHVVSLFETGDRAPAASSGPHAGSRAHATSARVRRQEQDPQDGKAARWEGLKLVGLDQKPDRLTLYDLLDLHDAPVSLAHHLVHDGRTAMPSRLYNWTVDEPGDDGRRYEAVASKLSQEPALKKIGSTMIQCPGSAGPNGLDVFLTTMSFSSNGLWWVYTVNPHIGDVLLSRTMEDWAQQEGVILIIYVARGLEGQMRRYVDAANELYQCRNTAEKNLRDASRPRIVLRAIELTGSGQVHLKGLITRSRDSRTVISCCPSFNPSDIGFTRHRDGAGRTLGNASLEMATLELLPLGTDAVAELARVVDEAVETLWDDGRIRCGDERGSEGKVAMSAPHGDLATLAPVGGTLATLVPRRARVETLRVYSEDTRERLRQGGRSSARRVRLDALNALLQPGGLRTYMSCRVAGKGGYGVSIRLFRYEGRQLAAAFSALGIRAGATPLPHAYADESSVGRIVAGFDFDSATNPITTVEVQVDPTTRLYEIHLKRLEWHHVVHEGDEFRADGPFSKAGLADLHLVGRLARDLYFSVGMGDNRDNVASEPDSHEGDVDGEQDSPEVDEDDSDTESTVADDEVVGV